MHNSINYIPTLVLPRVLQALALLASVTRAAAVTCLIQRGRERERDVHMYIYIYIYVYVIINSFMISSIMLYIYIYTHYT